MGIFSNSLLSDKFTNAFIVNSDNEGFFVKIKYVLGDYFLADFKNQLYCFKMVGSRQITVKIALVKMYKFYIFFTDHYMPVSPENIKLLEDTLKKNTLPKVDERQLSLLKILGGKEKHNEKEFTPHDLAERINEIIDKGSKYPDAIDSLRNFIDGLSENTISTPVKRLSEFLDGELVTTDPRFLGMVAEQHKKTDAEQKKMSNTPEKGKVAWLKIMLVIVLVGAIIGIGYVIYSSGMLGGITGGIQLPGQTGTLTQSQLMQKYPTPEALKAAIDKGEIQYKDLPPPMKAMVDKVKPEQAAPLIK